MTSTLFHRVPRRVLILIAAGAALGIGIALWRLESGAAAPESTPTVEAVRADVIVSVGGVGRIVQASQAADIAVPASAGSGGASSSASGAGTGATTAPADAVFPRTTGRISRFLVAPGQHVSVGQPLALLDDGGAAAAAVRQAQIDVSTARLELRQKRTSDPTNGLPATAAELEAGQFAVTSARAQVARLLGHPRRADVVAARLDVERAQADLETLEGGTRADRADAIRVARLNVQLAQQVLNRLLAPPDAADVSAAQAEVKKAEAELAALKRAPQAPLPQAVTAANQAVTVARQNLAKAQAGGDPAEISSAQLDLDKALADLAALQQTPPAPSAEDIAAAQQAVDAAKAKVAKLLAGANPADVQAARADLAKARAELRKLEAGPSPLALAAARQAVASARARLAQLLGRPLPSDLTAARLEVVKARADLAVLRARGGPGSRFDVGLAQLKVQAAQAQLATARFAKRLLTVRAPSAGTLTSLLTVSGAPVDATTPIAAVADLDHLAVSIGLSEFDAAHVTRNLRAQVSVDALGGKTFPGRVVYAGPTGTDSGGVVTFPVQVSIKYARGLKPGMNVSVRIIVAERRRVVQVPLEAVKRDGEDRAIVTVVDKSGEESLRKVTLGLANNKNVEIVKGLRAGERVLLAAGQGAEEE